MYVSLNKQGKMKREMKDIEKENDILDSKLERMEDL